MPNKSYSDSLYFSRKMLLSKAYFKLTGSSIKVLNIFFMKRKVVKVKGSQRSEYMTTNNGDIKFSYKEAHSKYKFNKSTFGRAIDQLIELGFIELTHQGGGQALDFNKYALINQWANYETDTFNISKRPKTVKLNDSYLKNFVNKIKPQK